MKTRCLIIVTIITLCAAIDGEAPPGWAGESFFGMPLDDLNPVSALKRPQARPAGTAALSAPFVKNDPLTEDRMISEVPEKKGDAAWNEIDFRLFRLSLSSMLQDQSVGVNYIRYTRENNPWGGSQAMPDWFQGFHEDALHTLGRIVEPQLRFEITF